jgi:predicted nucleic acid-binding protein
MTKYTFDACALIALINEEAGVDVVDNLLQCAQSGKAVIYMSVINLIEVYYGYIREQGADRAAELLETILAYPITIVHTITDPVFRESSRIKAFYRIPLGDAVACATADSLGSVLVTADWND